MTTAEEGGSLAQRIDVRDEVVPDDFTESPPFVSPDLPDNTRSTAFAAERALVGNDGTSNEAESAILATLCRQIIEGLVPWLPWVSLAWLGGVMVVAVRHLGGWVGVQRLRWVGTTKVSRDLSDRTRQLMDRMKISRRVRILQSSLAELPIVVGWLRPVVLLPASLLTGLSPRQLEAILAHELAHVRRYDYLVNLLQTAAETLLFYHPAVWWLSRRIRVEREHCCDDVAVAVCGNKVDYAEALAAIEQRRAAALAMAVGVHGRMGSALGRVRRVLGISVEDRMRWTQAIGGSVAVLLLIVALVSYMAATSEAQWGQDHQATPESSGPGPKDVDVPLPDNEDEGRVAQVVEQSGDEKYPRRQAAGNPAEIQMPPATTGAEMPEHNARERGAVCFGPVIEQSLKAPHKDGTDLLDLDTGKTTTRKYVGIDRGTLREIRDQGIDAMVSFPGGPVSIPVLDLFDVAAHENPSIRWEDITAEEVARHMQLTPRRPKTMTTLFPTRDRPKAPSLFRTREGGMGVLQLVGAEGSECIKIRYRLVRDSEPGDAAKDRRDEAIRGRVLDAAGKPVAGAKVFLSGPETLLLIDGKDEFRSRTSAEADAQGRFVLARDSREKANRLIVTAPSLHVWIEPGPWLDEELTIRLPEPATLVLRYDIEGDLPEVRFRLQLDHTKKLGWTGVVDSIQYPVAENGGQVTVMLTPGSYGLARLKPLRWRSGEMDTFRKNAFCDQQMLEVKPGERKVVDFVRPVGRRVSGDVVGLPEGLRKDAFVYVCQTTERMEIPVGKRRLSVVHPVGVLDAVTSDEMGRFTSALIPPGAYTVIAHAYKPGPQHGQLGVLLPDLVGTARVTVPEDGEPPKVRIEMTSTSHEAVEGAAEGTAAQWGPAVEGVQCRVRAEKLAWPEETVPRLFADLRNQGTRNLKITIEFESWEMEIDGEWYETNSIFSGMRRHLPLEPGTQQQDLEVSIFPDDSIGRKLRALRPGKHTLRVARLFGGHSFPPEDALRVVSNPVEIQIVRRMRESGVRILRTFPNTAHVQCVALSADGRLLATGDADGTVKIRHPSSGQSRWFVPVVDRRPILAIAFSPDGRTLAAACPDAVQLLDAESGKPRITLNDCALGHERPEEATASPMSIAFSPDGTTLATGGGLTKPTTRRAHGTLRLWDPQTGKLKHELPGHPSPVRSIAFSPDGKFLASVGADDGSGSAVKLWDLRTVPLRLSRKLVFPDSVPHPIAFSIAFSPDGKMIAVDFGNADSADGYLAAWNAQTGARQYLVARPQPEHSMAFSPDGTTLAVAGADDTVTLLDPETGTPTCSLSPGTGGWPRRWIGPLCVAFSPARNLLVTGGAGENGRGFVTIWGPEGDTRLFGAN